MNITGNKKDFNRFIMVFQILSDHFKASSASCNFAIPLRNFVQQLFRSGGYITENPGEDTKKHGEIPNKFIFILLILKPLLVGHQQHFTCFSRQLVGTPTAVVEFFNIKFILLILFIFYFICRKLVDSRLPVCFPGFQYCGRKSGLVG